MDGWMDRWMARRMDDGWMDGWMVGWVDGQTDGRTDRSHFFYLFNSDPNTLFRGNSVASKFIDEFMKVVGHSYLHRTLQPCIDEVCT